MVLYGVFAGVGVVLLLASFLLDDILDGVLDAGPDWLTGISIGGFLTVLGLIGMFGTTAGWPVGVTAIVAFLGAAIIGALINVVALRLIKSSTTDATTVNDLVGLEGTSVLGSAAGAAGEIMLTVKGHPMKVNGRCQTELKAGDRVRVTSAMSITSVTVEAL